MPAVAGNGFDRNRCPDKSSAKKMSAFGPELFANLFRVIYYITDPLPPVV
jgi:hypothetical protein